MDFNWLHGSSSSVDWGCVAVGWVRNGSESGKVACLV